MDTAHECRQCGQDTYVYYVGAGYEQCTECGHRRNIANAWFASAACRGLDPDLFHPEKGERSTSWQAKAICETCQVIKPCLRYAIANGEQLGVWGGLSASERRSLRGTRQQLPILNVKCHGCRDTFRTTNRKKKWCTRSCYLESMSHPAARRKRA